MTQDHLDLLARCYADRAYAAKALWPERFRRPFDPIHRQIFDFYKNMKGQLGVLAAPRGIGKTSIANLVLPGTAALFQDAKYIVPISSSSTGAVQQSENLKQNLLRNPTITKLFGDITTDRASKEQWVVRVGNQETCIMPRGSGQQVRGMLFKDYRPDLIIVDDLEKSDEMANEEIRKAQLDWFYDDLLNCVDRGDKNWKIIVVGTVLHQNSLLVRLLEDPTWESLTLEICDDDFHTNAPNFMTDRECEALYNKYKAQGKVDGFYREYRNIAVPVGKDGVFKQEQFHSYRETEAIADRNDPRAAVFLIVDPAKTTNESSADTGMTVARVNMSSHKIQIITAQGKKLSPLAMYQEIGDLIILHGVTALGIEVTSLHEFILHPLKNELARRGLNVQIVELHARAGVNEKGKAARVKTLLPYYEAGLIHHNEGACNTLEQQLLSFPRSRRWDVMDSAGYLPEMLEKAEIYMDARSVNEDPNEVESEYAGLEDEYMAPLDRVGLF